MTETIEMTPVADTITEKPTDKMDMALDDIVKSMKKPRRGAGRGRGGRGNSKGKRTGGQRNQNAQKKQGGGKGVKVPQSLKTGPPKLSISNLNFQVSDSDIRELFSEFGKMKNAVVHYNSSGKSLGTAHVIFVNKEQAAKAMKQYNGVHLDGRPMRISMEGGIVNVGGKKGNIVKRLGKGPQGAKGKNGAKGKGGNKGKNGGKGKGRGEKPKPKTAEELDAELDAYLNSKSKSAGDLDAELEAYSNSKDASDKSEGEAEK